MTTLAVGESTLHDVLRRAALFDGVDPDAATTMARQFATVDLKRGRNLFREGDEGDSLYVVPSGKVKLGRLGARGRGNVVAVMGPSDQFGELSLLDAGPRTSTATALTSVRVAQLDQSTLHRWLQEQPRLAVQLLRLLARRLRTTDAKLADRVFIDVPGRVAGELLQLADRFGSVDGSTGRRCT